MNFLANKTIGQAGNLLIQNKINEISRESISLGFFEGIKLLLISFAVGLFIRFLYKRFATSYSSKDDYGNTILIVIISVSALIAVVKSSLALSLGLVGALSVVRFRTAVKEPTNLGFLLFSICIGISIGASQTTFALVTLLIGSISIIYINLNSGVKSKFSLQKESSIDTISLTLPIDADIKQITNFLSEECQFFEVQTLEQSPETNSCNITLKIKFKTFESLNNLRVKIRSNFKDSKIIFFNTPVY
tara:strand:+ start:223 stop:963 length:741 start_codon:yes stop_codon:yes gene_type:complete